MVDHLYAFAGKLLCGEIRCLLCGQNASSDLCLDCFEELPWLDRACRRCAIPLLAADGLLCGDCLRRTPPFTRCIAPLEYGWPVNELIMQFKTRARLPFGRLLTSLLFKKIQQSYNCDTRPSLLVAVPISKKRLRERGFNQAWLIARRLGRNFGLPASDSLLVRNDDLLPQKSLPARTRHTNLKDAFSLLNAIDGHVALIDDVVTTGATASTLASLLIDAGATRVDVWCLARTPRKGEAWPRRPEMIA